MVVGKIMVLGAESSSFVKVTTKLEGLTSVKTIIVFLKIFKYSVEPECNLNNGIKCLA